MIQSGALGRIHSITGSYVQDWLLYPTDYNWARSERRGRASCAPSPTSAPTGWDLVQFITGLSVSAVQADLKTVHTTRHRPIGEVETFSAKVQAAEATESIAIETEDSGAALLRFNAARTAPSGYPR